MFMGGEYDEFPIEKFRCPVLRIVHVPPNGWPGRKGGNGQSDDH